MEHRVELGQEEIEAFAPDSKVGLLATLDDGGLPHISLITTITAKDRTHLTFGQFCEGMSKTNLKRDPRAAFLVLTQARDLWRGKALWTHSASEGAEYEDFNRRPMFRYNSYFGIHTVQYLDLVGIGPKEKLSVPRMAAGWALATPGKVLAFSRGTVLSPWARKLLGRLDTLKFLAHVDQDGYPTLIPAVPATTAGSRRLVFVPTAYRRELHALRPGDSIALFGLNMAMQSVLVRGPFVGYMGLGPGKLGIMDIDWVYNSMLPQHGQVYPRSPLAPVQQFDI